jgi:hypothetical protein
MTIPESKTSTSPTMDAAENLQVDTWKLKLGSKQPAICDLCGGERRWGIGKGRFHFCDKHNSWRNYFAMRLAKRPFCKKQNAIEVKESAIQIK